MVGLYMLFYLITAIGFLWLMFSILGAEIENNVKTDVKREYNQITAGESETITERVQNRINRSDILENLYILNKPDGEVTLSNYPYDTRLTDGWLHLNKIEDVEKTKLGIEDDGKNKAWVRDIDILPANPHDEGYIGWVGDVGGYKLFVGRSLNTIDETKDILVRMALLVLPLSLFLATLGGLLFHRLTIRRIEVINEQCRTIRNRGDISLRVPNEKPDDEYGLLIANINAMLETIDRGVKNVQEVSDDVAHDLRTPLTRMKYGLESGLVQKNATKADLQDVIKTSLVETDNLLETFSAILRISQLNAGRRKSKFKVFDITELAETITDAYAPTAEEFGHTLSLEWNNHSCMINGDKDMIGQLFSNLIENTFQHAGNSLAILIKVHCNPSDVIVSVEDDGRGIPEDEKSKIFNKFYCIDKSRSQTGSGLGLAIVKAITELHNGKIQVENCNPGLRFTATLPRDMSPIL